MFAFVILLLGAQACITLPAPTTQEVPTPEVITIVVTATTPPEPVPTNTEAPPVEEIASTTSKQDLNVRAGPGTGYNISNFLPGGTTVPVIGKNADGSWLLVEVGGETGWVSTSFTEPTGLEMVPVVNVAPPPPPSGGSGTSPTATTSGGGANAPSDSDINVEVNVKNDNKFLSGEISYPGGDHSDRVYVRVVGFDSGTSSGYLNYSLSCTGTGAGAVKVSGGGACNDGWSKIYYYDNYNDTIQIYLDSGGSAFVNWTLVISANN